MQLEENNRTNPTHTHKGTGKPTKQSFYTTHENENNRKLHKGSASSLFKRYTPQLGGQSALCFARASAREGSFEKNLQAFAVQTPYLRALPSAFLETWAASHRLVGDSPYCKSKSARTFQKRGRPTLVMKKTCPTTAAYNTKIGKLKLSAVPSQSSRWRVQQCSSNK